MAADFAIKQAIKLAKKTGIGIVGVKNSGHYGLSGYYIEQAVNKNLLALCFTNAPPAKRLMEQKSLFGINPLLLEHHLDPKLHLYLTFQCLKSIGAK